MTAEQQIDPNARGAVCGSALFQHLGRVSIDKVLLVDSFLYDSRNSLPGKARSLALAMRAAFWERPTVSGTSRKGGALFVKSMGRPDYDGSFRAVVGSCPIPFSVADVSSRRTVFPRLSPLRVLVCYRAAFSKLPRCAPLRFAYLAFRLAHYIEAAEAVLENARFSVLTVFADMQPIDNLLVQLARQMGIPTVTLQHGLYIDYESCPNINQANYRNVVSDHFLAWGEVTRDLILRFHPRCNVEVCGKPGEVKSVDAGRTIPDETYITVIFDQNLLKEQNKRLLGFGYAIAQEMGAKLNVRPHPYSKLADYEIEEGTLIDAALFGSRWILAHTSTLIHELLSGGVPVLKLTTEVPSLDTPAELQFATLHELREVIARGGLAPERCVVFAKSHIAMTGTKSIGAYARFFERVLHRSAPAEVEDQSFD